MNKKLLFLKRSFYIGLTTIVLIVWMPIIWCYLTYPEIDDLPPLQDGDLVFQTHKSSQSLAIMLASHSMYSHIGMIKLADDGRPVVVEAVGPVRETPMDEWIASGYGGRLSVMRIKDLTSKSADKALAESMKYYGRPYDIFFLFDRAYIYCSELVYYAFKEGAGIELGRIEQAQDLSLNNFAAQKLIRKRWQFHPYCSGKSDYISECYQDILKQEMVTPASIAQDKKLLTIYSNYIPF